MSEDSPRKPRNSFNPSQGMMRFLDPSNAFVDRISPDRTLFLIWAESRKNGRGVVSVDAHEMFLAVEGQSKN